MSSGIYEIVNTSTNQRYIGSAADFGQRWRSHRRLLRRGQHHSPRLQNAWNKYGENAFEFRKLLVCAKGSLLMYEQRALDALTPEFNVLRFAGSSLGHKHRVETRERIAASAIGNTRTKGIKHTEEARANMGAASRGRYRSPEVRANMSAAQIGRPYAPGRKTMKGFKHSPETRAKVSAALRGRPVSEETRRKMSESIRAAFARKRLAA